jgi:cytochrome P450
LSDAELFRPDQNQRDDAQMQRVTKTNQEMSDYFGRMLEERRRAPRDDMMSGLLAAEVDGEHLSLEDAISFCRVLLIAGHVTTTNLLSQAIRCFDEYPEVMEQLRKEPELMPGAIEEVLRYASPIWRLIRRTRTDVTLAGVTIPEDTMVFAWLASANRDGEQFREPERFDITRMLNRHIAFGHGIHFCVGARVARLEASIALPMILEQLPNLQILHTEPLELFKGGMLFSFKHLPATFTPTAG